MFALQPAKPTRYHSFICIKIQLVTSSHYLYNFGLESMRFLQSQLFNSFLYVLLLVELSPVSDVSYVLFGLLKRSWCFLFEAFDISIAQLFRITFYKPGGQFSWVNSLKRAPFLYHFFQIFGWLGRAIRRRRWNYFLLMFHPKITISYAHALNLNWRNYFP